MTDDLWPYWVKSDPTAAHEFLRLVHQRLLTGGELAPVDRDYLRETIGNLLAQIDSGKPLDKLNAAAAFYLTPGRGRPAETFSERNRRIWWYVRRQLEANATAEEAKARAAWEFFPLDSDAFKKVGGIVEAIDEHVGRGGIPPGDPDAGI